MNELKNYYHLFYNRHFNYLKIIKKISYRTDIKKKQVYIYILIAFGNLVNRQRESFICESDSPMEK